MKNIQIFWLIFGWLGILIFPWYQLDDGFFSFNWLFSGSYFEVESAVENAPLIYQSTMLDKFWLLPVFFVYIFSTIIIFKNKMHIQLRSSNLNYLDSNKIIRLNKILFLINFFGFFYVLLQGFIISLDGFTVVNLSGERILLTQQGFGVGALFCLMSLLMIMSYGLSSNGYLKGDYFILSSILSIIVLVALFVFFPLTFIFISAFQEYDGGFSIAGFTRNLFSADIWGLSCFSSKRCGVAWNSIFLAILTAISTTSLGLIFALTLTRTSFRFKKFLRMLTILPIITPPFVIGLVLILLLGRSGAITQFVANVFGLEGGRWLYGLPGIWLAQTLSLTPISFLVLIGVVEGVSPSMEEASQTMRAGNWETFKRVTLPLMRPGIAAAFLLGFIESLADFGNPMILGGNYSVLATEIYFAIVGAQNDPSRAAVLSIILLFFTLSAFFLQRAWVGKKGYSTVSGKGDGGIPLKLHPILEKTCLSIAIPWAIFTLLLYAMVIFGGFVERLGFDHSLTFKHYQNAFGFYSTGESIRLTGAAWDSFWSTIKIAGIASPLTAVIGLITAYLLTRYKFKGKNLFEFGTMLSFAIPGTVIGVSYVIAFNVPPFEFVGTATILVICFVFRNMSVGVRGGIAAMSQLDKNLDEASITLGANSFTTLRRVMLPLLKPALVAALVYSFVRAMTSVSAVVFLVSAEHYMATSFIIGLVENSQYGLAIAYCSVLIIVMLCAVLLVQRLVGNRKIRR